MRGLTYRSIITARDPALLAWQLSRVWLPEARKEGGDGADEVYEEAPQDHRADTAQHRFQLTRDAGGRRRSTATLAPVVHPISPDF